VSHAKHTTVARPGCPGQDGGLHWPGGCRCLVDATATHGFIRSLAAVGWAPAPARPSLALAS
jgi:hypothetical protein